MSIERADSRPGSRRPSTALRGLHAQTVETIGSRIVSGQYASGAPLPPEELETEFGISKTVLREALRVLAAKGLVDARQKRGTVVRPRASWSLLDADVLRWQGAAPDAAFLANLADVRRIVEPAGAKLAAQRRTDADLDTLREAMRAMEAAETDAVLVEADLAFHGALLAAAHNELLSRMEVVIEAGLRARDEVVHSGEHWPDSISIHKAIVDAIQARDATAAAATVESLLERASQDAELAARRQPRSDARAAKKQRSKQKGTAAE